MKNFYTITIAILLASISYAQSYEFGIKHISDNHFKIIAIPDFDSDAYGDVDGNIDASDIGFTLVNETGMGIVITKTADDFRNTWDLTPYDATFMTNQGVGDGTKDIVQFNLPPGQQFYSHAAGDEIALVSFDVDNMPATTSMYIMLNNDPINVNAGNIFESFFNTALNTDNYDTQNYFTGLVAGMESFDFSTLTINDLALVNFNYYPNPVKDELHVTANENINQISIYNMLGQEVINIAPAALTTKINTANLTNGTYFIKAQVGLHTGTYKFIKQ